jgi:hypothetical protein
MVIQNEFTGVWNFWEGLEVLLPIILPRLQRHNRKLNSILLHSPIPSGTDPSSRYIKSVSKRIVELIDTELGYMERDDREACGWSQERCIWLGSSD